MASKVLDPIDILLEMGIDLDDLSDQDYLGALKEAIATIEFKTSGKGDERSVALREEVIKLRRPKVKRTKISAEAFKKGTAIGGFKKATAIGDKKGGALTVRPSSSLVPSSLKPEENEESVEEDKKEKKESVVKILSDISKTVNSILKTLKQKNKLDKKTSKQDRLKAERDKRALAEKNLEKRFTSIKNFAQKMIKPLMGPFDALINFIKNIILGKIVLGIIDWFGNPDNQQKVQSFIRFLKDWWPALITAVLLFATPLGGIIAGIVTTLTVATGKLLTLLPKLLKFLKSPFVIGLGLFAVGAAVPALLPETVETETDEKVDQSVEEKGGQATADALRKEQEEREKTQNPFMRFLTGTVMGEDAERKKQIDSAETGKEPVYKSRGGFIPRGTDTVPAMLTPGEFVIKKDAVQKYGVDTLTSMNSMTKSLPSYEGGGAVDERKFGKKSESLMPIIGPPLMESKMSSIPGMGGGSNTLTKQAKVKTFGGILSDLLGLFRKKEVDPQTILEDEKLKAKSIDPFVGEVKESSGLDIPGATADRQFVKVQPGESILPVDTVTSLGGPAAVDRLIAQTDSNSTPAKLGMRSERMIPGAPMRSGPMINVVPMQAPAGGKEAIDPSGSILPNFSAGTGSSLKARSLGVIR
jgi:hypothetical protein